MPIANEHRAAGLEPDGETLGERVLAIHAQLAGFCPSVRRIAVAVYDPRTDVLRTFLRSAPESDELCSYERRLAEVPSLRTIAERGQPRVIDDLTILASSPSDHSVQLLASGYRSSFTVPLYANARLQGFLFFDADRTNVFSSPIVAQLMVYSQLLSLLIAHERSTVSTLLGAVRTALHFSRFRDEETAAHLARMAHFSKLIAVGLPDAMRPDDEAVEYLLHFSPLHDIGKIGVPDGILRKPGRLTREELSLMRAHVEHGAAMVDVMLAEFGLGELHHVAMLRNIVLHHHENFDGSGYSAGLAGDAIPLEARIVKVADVFDALTSERPYKHAWSNEQAFDYIRRESGRLFDPACAESLLRQEPAVREIQTRFQEGQRPGAAF